MYFQNYRIENFDLHFFQSCPLSNSPFYNFYHTLPAAYFLGYLAAPFWGYVFGGQIFEMGWRQIFRLDEAAELTFTGLTLYQTKAELRQSFSTCVYCMRLHFQRNFLG